MESNNRKIAMRVSFNTVAGNIALSVFKLLAGILGNSAAMLSDAVHSLSDVFSTLIVIVGLKISGKKADKNHPYGHERFESAAAMILAVILCATGAGIGYDGVGTLLSRPAQGLPVPGLVALIAAIASLVVKEAMFRYTRAAAKKVRSTALMASAWHHRSDALSSIGSFAGILGARVGLPVLDVAACLVICVLILKAAWDIFMDAINKMMDKACDDVTVAAIRSLILAQDKVRGVDLLRTRLFGDRVYVDVEIGVDGSTPLQESHAIAHTVHDAIERSFHNVKHCMVHVNPQGE